MGASQSIMDAKPAIPPPAAVVTKTDAPAKPKPCCVCKEEKQKRDECMLFSKAADPAEDCKSLVEKYKTCMAGFGY